MTTILLPARRLDRYTEWLILLALSMLVVLLRLPSLEQPFDNDSGAIAYHARLIIRGEPLYGTHHPGHHMPAVYYVYALAFALFGDSVWAVKLVLLLWTIGAAYLLYRLGVLVSDRTVGFLGAVFYVVLSSHILLYGSTAEIELFANLPRVAAVLVLIHLELRLAPASRHVLVGLLGAVSFMFKAVYLSPLVIAGFSILVEMWLAYKNGTSWRRPLERALWMVVGFLIVVLPVTAYFAALGLLPRFLKLFELGLSYVDLGYAELVGPQRSWAFPLLGLAINNVVLLALGLGGLLEAVSVQCRPLAGHRVAFPGTSYVALWLALSFVEASVARVQFLYYYQLVVPPLTLLGAWFLLRMYRTLVPGIGASSRRWVGEVALIAMLVISLAISAKQNSPHYSSYFRYKAGTGSYGDFLYRGWFERLGSRFVQLQELADYVTERTAPSDYVYYWSGNVQFYYLADRRCPIDMIWPINAQATGPYERIFVPRTKYVIVGESFYIGRPAWLYEELARSYRLETVLHGQEIYRRSDSGA